MFRPINDTNERYIINEEGIVIDTHPAYMEHMEWQWLTIVPTEPREVTITEERFCYVLNNGKKVIKNIHSILLETFPELYQISDESKQRIINSYKKQDTQTYTISIKDFNRLIYPNELIQIYDTTSNKEKGRKWKKPTIIRPNEKGKVILRKGRSYFGIGTRNIIHFDENGLPYNTKEWAEPISSRYHNDSELF